MKYLAIHHTAVSRQVQKSQFWAVDTYHKGKFGMRSTLGYWIAYSHFIGVNGVQTQTRVYTEEQCANVGHNCDVPARCDVISVCFAGNFDVELPLPEQIESFKTLYKRLKIQYPDIEITFHRLLSGNGKTSCPGGLFTKEYLATLMHGGTVPSEEDAKKQREQAEISRYQQIIHILQQWLIARGITPVQ